MFNEIKKIFVYLFKTKNQRNRRQMQTDISIIKCFATDCFFNRSYTGECSCDLKEIEIDNKGQCFTYCERVKTAEHFNGKNKK